MAKREDDEQGTETEDVEAPRSFGVFLNRIAYGDCERECSDELFKLMRKLREESQQSGVAKGTMTLKLGLEVDEQGEVKVLTLCAETPAVCLQRCELILEDLLGIIE